MAKSGTRNTTQSVSSTSSEICPNRWGKRKSIIITNTSAAAKVTLAKGDFPATAGQGIGPLQPTATWAEGSDQQIKCWQGAIQAVSDVAGSVSISEELFNEYPKED